jgi:hypothetical protein
MNQPKPNKLCVGCKALLLLRNMSDGRRRRIYNTYECKFTPSGVKRIPNCPCTNCLVKVTCIELCLPLTIICNTRYSRDEFYNLTRVNEGKD